MDKTQRFGKHNPGCNNLILQSVKQFSGGRLSHATGLSLDGFATSSKGGEGSGVKSFPHRRGYAGRLLIDCIRHDDYRSPAFTGPMVAA